MIWGEYLQDWSWLKICKLQMMIIILSYDGHCVSFARLHKVQFVGITWNYSLNKRCFCQPVVFLFCSPARHCRSWLWQLFLIQQYSRRISAPVRLANFLTMTWREYWTIIIHCPLQKDARWKAESQKAELLQSCKTKQKISRGKRAAVSEIAISTCF